MKEELLKEFLDRYYKGDTSLEEELILKEFFSGVDIVPGYEAEKEILQHYSEIKGMPAPPENLEKKILNGIDEYEKQQRPAFKRVRMLAAISIAAALLIFAVSYFLLAHQTEPKDTYSDPRLAYAETIKVLRDVSVKLNRGRAALKPVSAIDRAAVSIGSITKSTSLLTEKLKPIALVNKLSGANNKKLSNNHN